MSGISQRCVGYLKNDDNVYFATPAAWRAWRPADQLSGCALMLLSPGGTFVRSVQGRGGQFRTPSGRNDLGVNVAGRVYTVRRIVLRSRIFSFMARRRRVSFLVISLRYALTFRF